MSAPFRFFLTTVARPLTDTQNPSVLVKIEIENQTAILR